MAVKTQSRFVADRIDILPPARASRRIYPWEKWTDGNPWTIRRGTDFSVEADSMATMIRNRAAATGMTVSTRRVEDDVIAFQFSESGSAAA